MCLGQMMRVLRLLRRQALERRDAAIAYVFAHGICGPQRDHPRNDPGQDDPNDETSESCECDKRRELIVHGTPKIPEAIALPSDPKAWTGFNTVTIREALASPI
jgi:hypothetical protein